MLLLCRGPSVHVSRCHALSPPKLTQISSPYVWIKHKGTITDKGREVFQVGSSLQFPSNSPCSNGYNSLVQGHIGHRCRYIHKDGLVSRSRLTTPPCLVCPPGYEWLGVLGPCPPPQRSRRRQGRRSKRCAIPEMLYIYLFIYLYICLFL